MKAISGRDFPAASHHERRYDEDALFEAQEGCEVLTLMKSRILRGYFTMEGQIDGAVDWKIESVGKLEEGEVLVDMYRGVAILLKRTTQSAEFSFVRVCPHALSENGVDGLVQRWSDVVCDGFALGINEREGDYKTAPKFFKIR